MGGTPLLGVGGRVVSIMTQFPQKIIYLLSQKQGCISFFRCAWDSPLGVRGGAEKRKNEMRPKTTTMSDEFGMHYHAEPHLFEFARYLRENMTKAEKVLWEHLRGKKLAGLKFRRQHPMGAYIVDFYCHSKKLIIEVDGKYHEDDIQQQKDSFRDSEMERFDIQVLRFTNEEVLTQTESVLEQIKTAALTRTFTDK